MIVDTADIGSHTTVLNDLKSINLITGLTSGINTIVPAAMLSDNFDITYGLGHLTIREATLTVKAIDTSAIYGALPVFRDTVTGFRYMDSIGNSFASLATHSLTDTLGNPVSANPGAGYYKIIPGGAVLKAPPNYILNYQSGNLVVNKSLIKALATDTSRIYGSSNPVFAIRYSGFINGDNSSTIVAPVATTIATANSPVGNYPIVLTGGSSVNYSIQNTNGTMTVTKATLLPPQTTRQEFMGIPNPAFTISYNGFLNADGPSKITQPTIGTSATVFSPVGLYPITLSGGTATNYQFVFNPGTLTINQASLNVKADDKVINDDDNLPVFTSTITGFRNGEANTITCGPSYSVSPLYRKDHPGVYTITPYGLKLTYQNNYNIMYLPGTLYVNDDNGKNVNPKLDCVELLTNDPSGFKYAAHFSYQNPNATVVYVPLGTNNKITTTGNYSGQLPTIFNPEADSLKYILTAQR